MGALSKQSGVIDEDFLLSLEALDLYIHKVMSGRFGGKRRSRGAGSSVEFLDYRDYVPGDDIRRIDWKLFGRLGRHYIRRFVDERQQETNIYLDLSRSMDADGTGRKPAAALRLAAAAGFLSVQNLDRVSFRLVRDGICRDLCGSVMGREAFYRAAEALGEVSFNGGEGFVSGIRNDPSPGYDDGLSILISDFLFDENWKEAVDYLLSRRREAALIQIMTPEEVSPAFAGPSFLIDSESGDNTDYRNIRLSVDRMALKAYDKAFHSFRGEMLDFCRSRGAALLFVQTDEPVVEALIKKGFQAGLIC